MDADDSQRGARRRGEGIPTLDPETLDPSMEPLGFERQRAAPSLARGGDDTSGGLTADGRLRAGKLAGLGMGAAIWTLGWPILVESSLNSLVGLTDTVLAAGLDDGGAGADAIGGASYVLWFIGLVVMAIGVGATAMVSRGVGGKKLALASAVYGQTILLALVCGTATGLLVAALSPIVPQMLRMGPETAKAFSSFLLINAAGVPFTAVLFCGIACLRGAGDSRSPLIAMVVVNIVNMLVSWTLAGVDLRSTKVVNGETVSRVLLHNPFDFHLGVQGIAIGTVLSQCVGAAIVVWMMTRGVGGVNGVGAVALRARRLKPHWHTMVRLARLGWPNFLETFGMWAGNFLVILMVGWMAGTAGGLLGSHIITIRIEAFSFLPGFAMGAAAATLAGQYLGAGSPAMAKKAVAVCTIVSVVQMGIMGAVFVVWPRAITGLITAQPAHLEVVPTLLAVTGAVQIPFAVSIVLRSALRGVGDVRAAMWMTWVTTYGVRLPLAYALSGVAIPVPELLGGGVLPNPFPAWFENGLVGLWVGMCIEVVVRAIVFGWRFWGGAWLSAKV